ENTTVGSAPLASSPTQIDTRTEAARVTLMVSALSPEWAAGTRRVPAFEDQGTVIGVAKQPSSFRGCERPSLRPHACVTGATGPRRSPWRRGRGPRRVGASTLAPQ